MLKAKASKIRKGAKERKGVCRQDPEEAPFAAQGCFPSSENGEERSVTRKPTNAQERGAGFITYNDILEEFPRLEKGHYVP